MIPGLRHVVSRLPIDNTVGGSTLLTAGPDILLTEFDGVAADFAYAIRGEQCRIKDTATPANDFRGVPLSKLTYTAPYVKMCQQADGIYRFANHNLELNSQDLSAATWTKTAITITADNTTAPDGTLTADLLTTTDNTTAGLGNSAGGTIATVVGVPYRLTWHAKYGNNTWFRFQVGDSAGTTNGLRLWFDLLNGALGSTAVLGTGWTLISRTIVAAANGFWKITIDFVPGHVTLLIPCLGCTADNVTTRSATGTTWYLWGAQVKRWPAEDAGGATYGEGYLATTAAVVYEMPYEWDAGIARGLRLEEARTNLCLRSSDFTNASWVKTTMTTSQTATGPDGIANSATILTASAGNATALQTITSASASRISSVFIKRRTGSGTINITQDNGTVWTAVTVTSLWTRVQSTNQTVTNPVVGIRIVTSADAVDVAMFQQELGTFPSTPIITGSATATRLVDNISVATSLLPFSSTVGTLYARFRPVSTAAICFAAAIDDGTANERFAIGSSAAAAGSFSVIDGGAAQTAPLTAGTISTTTDNRVAVSWVANDFAISTNGSTVALDPAGSVPTVTSLKFGGAFGAASPLNGWLMEVAYIKRTMSDTELIARAMF